MTSAEPRGQPPYGGIGGPKIGQGEHSEQLFVHRDHQLGAVDPFTG